MVFRALPICSTMASVQPPLGLKYTVMPSWEAAGPASTCFGLGFAKRRLAPSRTMATTMASRGFCMRP